MFLANIIVCFLCWLSCAFAIDYSVIIIGAGPAGVAAAAKLLENNITNIVILEAESRIGGRIQSVFFGDAYVELGAEWCHGKTDNVVYNLAAPLVTLEPDDADMELLYTKGALDSEFQGELNDFFLEEYKCEAGEKNLTIEAFYLPKYEDKVRKTYENDTEKLKIALAAKRLLEKYLLSYEGAFYLNNVTAASDFTYVSNESDYSWQGIGYKTILDILIHKFPNANNALPFYAKLKLNEEVVKIHWNESGGVVVDVANNGGSYRGQRVIFTPSLNVLKQDHGKLFVPELPPGKQAALQDLGMDAVMKIHAHFVERWWPLNGFNGYSFIWDGEALQGVEQTRFAWTTNICGILPADNNPQVLTAWITGPNIPKIELLSHEQIAEGIEFLLKTFLPNNYNITTPDKILKSDWYNNPHFRGTYSYQTVKAVVQRPSPEVVLAEPLSTEVKKNVVCFAGEATHPHFFSTVHGAIESGYREAQRITSTIKQH